MKPNDPVISIILKFSAHSKEFSKNYISPMNSIRGKFDLPRMHWAKLHEQIIDCLHSLLNMHEEEPGDHTLTIGTNSFMLVLGRGEDPELHFTLVHYADAVRP